MQGTLTLKKMNTLLARYGGNLDAWPEPARRAAVILLDSNEDARRLLQQYEDMSALLAQLPQPEFAGLEAKILAQDLPARRGADLGHILRWLLPETGFSRRLWRPVVAACLPLVFGVLLGNYFSFGVAGQDPGFQYWEDELLMLSLSDIESNSVSIEAQP